MENILEVKNLQKKYQGFTLKNISFSLPAGYIMGLIGPNGAGKTTVIKLIMNLVRKDGGEIRLFGKDNLQYEAEIKSRIGFVYDVPRFAGDIGLADIARAFGLFYEKWDSRLFTSLAGEFGLPLKKKFKKLSQGMKTKFALALALAHDADLVLMDEPTTGLDPVFRRELLDRLAGILENSGKSILFSTHITSDLERIADFITFLRDGEVVFSDSKDHVLENWGVVRGDSALLQTADKALLSGLETNAYGGEAITSDIRAARSCFGNGVVIEKASLEDIMYYISKGGNHAA